MTATVEKREGMQNFSQNNISLHYNVQATNDQTEKLSFNNPGASLVHDFSTMMQYVRRGSHGWQRISVMALCWINIAILFGNQGNQFLSQSRQQRMAATHLEGLLPNSNNSAENNVSATDKDNGDENKNNDNNNDINDLRPRNLHLAFVGDSVTRYQYISLVYFLSTGQWYPEPAAHNKSLLYRGNHFDSWNDYLQYSNDQFQPAEQCDCYRVKGRGYGNILENRYYYDADRNNSVTYILKYGKATAHGFWEAPIVHRHHRLNISTATPSTNYTWNGYNWSAVIGQHLALLEPKPLVVVFNAGLHPHELLDPHVQDDIQAALLDSDMIGIYKTTTRTRALTRKSRFQRGRHDRAVCGRHGKDHNNGTTTETGFFNCLNLDWTGDLIGDDYYYDDNHFKATPNRIMNEQLLEYLDNYYGKPNGTGGGGVVAAIDDLQAWTAQRSISLETMTTLLTS